VHEIIREEDLRAKLTKSLKTGKPLRAKLGVDPPHRTSSRSYCGPSQAQTFSGHGHIAVFLIGDFTAMVGDPTGQVKPDPLFRESGFKPTPRLILNRFSEFRSRQTEIR
jgi:tyrosyl-tRNA synthetase